LNFNKVFGEGTKKLIENFLADPLGAKFYDHFKNCDSYSTLVNEFSPAEAATWVRMCEKLV